MWIFGQVWFACLVGFGVGVLLDWVLRVRPLRRRVEELEQHQAAASPSRASIASPYGAGSAAEHTGGGEEAPRDVEPFRGGLTDLLTHDNSYAETSRPEPARPAEAEYGDAGQFAEPTPLTGQPSQPAAEHVDAAFSGGHPFGEQTQFAEHTPLAEQTSFTEPAPFAGQTSFADHRQFTEHDVPEPTQAIPPVPASIAFDGSNEADRQYLEYLRSGGGKRGRQTEPEPDQTAEERGALSLGGPRETEPVDAETAAEQTNILPPVVDDTETTQAGHNPELFPQAVSGDDLPHRSSGDRFAEHVPFVDNRGEGAGQDHTGPLTPIGDGGFLPFAKPMDPDEFTRHDLWVGENGQLIGLAADESGDPEHPSGNRYPETLTGQDERTDRSWFDHKPEAPAEEPAEFTQQIPVARDDTPPEDNRPRSLFEPIIAADQDGRHSSSEPSLPPRPIRVRTGVNNSAPRSAPAAPAPSPAPAEADLGRPVRSPAGSSGFQVGPFGPGSALPLPDGSAPSPQFRVKARTSSMVFHTENSPFYERLEPQVWFCSVDDAHRAGFTSWER